MLAVVGVGFVVVAAATGAGAVVGKSSGQRDVDGLDVVKSRREMLKKIDQSATEAEREAQRLTPVVAALRQQQEQLEADNAVALRELRTRWQVDCGGSQYLRFRTPEASAVGVELAETLRGDFPCDPGEGVDLSAEPGVAVDVVAFGTFSAGACGGAELVRITLTCSYTVFEQNCAGGDMDECARFRPPETTYRFDGTWGCIGSTPGGHEIRVDADQCDDIAGTVLDDDGDDDGEATTEVAHLYWAVRGPQVIYLAAASSGWADLGEAEVAPGVKHDDELKLVFRADESVTLPTDGALPDSFTFGGELVATDSERTDVNSASGGRVVDNDRVVSDGDGVWRRVTVDGRARVYEERIPHTRTFARALVDPGLTLGNEYVCERTATKAEAAMAAGSPWVRIGSQDGAALYHDGKPTAADDVGDSGLRQVYWVSPFSDLWDCRNRDASPIPVSVDEEPWSDDATDEDREQFPWCFQ